MQLESLALNGSSGSDRSRKAAELQPVAVLDSEVILRIRSRLLRWARRHYREFPWRSEQDPWLTLFAELLLQRTQAPQVAAAYPEIIRRFPTAQTLVSEGIPAVRYLTGKLGLHWRGELLLKIAERVALNGNRPPDDRADLLSMKGIGSYTAAAWLSLHRKQRAVIVDSNIARWLSRLSGQPRHYDVRRDQRVHQICDLLTPARAFKAYNYGVLDFTMTVCTPRKPLCKACPLRSDCRYAAMLRTSSGLDFKAA